MFDTHREHTSTERQAIELIERAEQRWPGYRNTAARTTLNAHYTDEQIIDQVWRLLRRLGVDDTAVAWEPGCGTGAWMNGAGAVPVIHGDELDPVTAQIATWSTPATTTVTRRSITDTRLPAAGTGRDGYDLVIGNVPFADYAPAAADNPDRLSLHNYAMVKAARMLRTGGYMAVITSRWTLDAARSAGGRDQLAALCDLIAAVRLPTGAHRKTAGTEVVTDLLLLRRSDRPEPWPAPEPLDVEGETVNVSGYYRAHPDRMLGVPALGGMRHGADLRVLHDGATDGGWLDDFARALDGIDGPEWALVGEAIATADRATRPRSAGEAPIGTISYDQGRFWQTTVDGWDEFTVRPAKDVGELRALIELRDLTGELLDAEVQAPGTADAIRERLAGRYEAYVDRYGPINRYSLRPTATKNSDQQTGDAMRRVYPTMGGFRRDPRWWNVAALELFDDDTQLTRPAATLSGLASRTVEYPTMLDDPEQVVTVLTARDGRLDDLAVADMAGIPVSEVDTWLGGHAFRDPATGALLPAATYLSGHVLDKLDAARDAAERDDRFDRNVQALTAVIPKRIGADEIVPRIGAPWIPPADLKTFTVDVLQLPNASITYTPALAAWEMRANGYSLANALHYGLDERHTALELVEDIANQRVTRITRTVDERQVLDVQATEAAAAKRVEIEDLFTEWIWSDPHRTERLEDAYNRAFNSYVEPRWDGTAMQLEGLAASFQPRPHQRDAICRVVAQRDAGTLLAHCVGAGKTAVMTIAAIELRRMGVADGPVAIVVPNSMLDQFTREVVQLYPHANVLAADDTSFAAPQRRQFVARVAAGDHDIVIFTHNAFGLIPMSPDAEQAFLDAEIDTLRSAMNDAPPEARRSVKQLERALANAEERAKQMAADTARDTASPVTFEQMRLGALIVDEAHLFKNLGFPTKIQDAAPSPSKRARDMAMKVAWLQDKRGPAAVSFATATPVSNRIAEMWVMQRFLDPRGLARAGVEHFDRWAANFARSVPAVEVAPSGRGFRTTTRFASYTNVPELARMFRSFADVRTAAQLDLPRPAITGGRPTVITIPADDSLHTFMEGLVDRAEAVKNRQVEPEEDNMLAISTDGRLAALDLRLIDPDRRDPMLGYQQLPIRYVGPKLERAAAEIAHRYHTGRDREYAGADGQPATRRGTTQIVFCDAGTPGNKTFDAYQALAEQLAMRGVPHNAVAFVQDASNHAQRAQLLSRVRSGDIAVLIGSTGSMGVGVNVQHRLAACHMLTVPWRPDEVEQAEGRILRQGNQNPDVEILRYVVEQSYDAYSWQTIERKANFVAQVMTAPAELARELRDDDDIAGGYALIKALATGDERILRAAQLEARVTQLERTQAMDTRTRRHLEARIAPTERRIANNHRLTETLPALIAQRDNTGPRTPHGDVLETATDLGRHTLDRIANLKVDVRYRSDGLTEPLATLRGLPLQVHVTRHDATITITGVDEHVLHRSIGTQDLHHVPVAGLGQQLHNVVNDLDRIVRRATDEILTDREQLAGYLERLAAPWPHHDELRHARTELAGLQAELMEHDDNETQPEPAPVAADGQRPEPVDRRHLDRARHTTAYAAGRERQ